MVRDGAVNKRCIDGVSTTAEGGDVSPYSNPLWQRMTTNSGNGNGRGPWWRRMRMYSKGSRRNISVESSVVAQRNERGGSKMFTNRLS